MRLGLEAIGAACERLGRPERDFPSVLIGGTNGKGSTAATLSSLAAEAGLRPGLYTSPHLVAVTERIRIGREDVPPGALDEALGRVFAAVDAAPAIPFTYFEATTAAAFLLFAGAGVDVGILEVGLGGRFDATNVAPAGLSVITSIAFDHMAELGGTLPLIAREKAGIFRTGRPALIRAEAEEALAALRDAAARAGAVLHEAPSELAVAARSVSSLGTAFDLETPERRIFLRTPLPGEHQAWNAALAVRAAELFPEVFGRLQAEAVARGVENVRWPGRLELLRPPEGRPVLLDGCHNPEGARSLARFLRDSGLSGLCPLVFGGMADKDLEGIARELFPAVSEVVLVRAAPPRGASPDELLERVGHFASRARTAPDVLAGIAALSLDAAGRPPRESPSPPIIVAGSLYLVGEARAHLAPAESGGADPGGRGEGRS
ncbi:MAG: bifunctional folylpolyglutamate synthase/dihydrofolate synthase [Acidobacteria bacterium]|nr:bifunctional folylpolyglutamate synthase/dihydrofolate synthase [Acidobacteriota bacterium]